MPIDKKLLHQFSSLDLETESTFCKMSKGIAKISNNSFLGIESSKSLQFKKYKQEQRDLLKTLAQLEKEKHKTIDEDEQYFVDNIPGDGITMLSVSPQSSNRGDDDSLEDEAEREEVLRKSLYFLEVQSIPTEEEQEKEAGSDAAKSGMLLAF